MPNPKLTGVSVDEENILYAKLNEYNKGRKSYKDVGAYFIVPPRTGYENYSLWIFSPLLERQSLIYLSDLSTDVHEALRMASTLFYFSNRCLLFLEYNEKRMQGNGEDIIPFGKYRGHYLHEILKIDPAYLSWIAYKYIPKIPKQERFVKMAQVYYSVHLDRMLRKTKLQQPDKRFLGEVGEHVKEITLKVISVRLEDDPFKTRINHQREEFFVRQVLTLADTSGNLAIVRIPSKTPSAESGCLPAVEHEYRPNDLLHIASARVARTYESHGSKYTRLSHVKLQKITAYANRP